MAEAESRKEAQAQDSKAGFWLDEIARAGKREKNWRDEGKLVVQRYKNEKKRTRSLNILWANTELLKPATLGRTPKPDVRQRFPVHNPVAHAAADVLEKALAFITDDPSYGLIEHLEYARDDMLLPGRGVVRLVYERDMRREKLQQIEEDDGSTTYETEDKERVEPDTIDENGFAFREQITRQEVYPKHEYWEDYREGDARCWDDVPWIAYKHTLTRKQLKDSFGEKGELVPLTLGTMDGKGDKENKEAPESPLSRAIVWEIWDKQTRTRVWVAESYRDDVLSVDDDPLGLEQFFPQPDPLYAIRTTDNRVPVPEFRIYKDQADELDDISLRIKRLVDACKVRGVYAAVVKEMGDLLNGDENELIPVEDFEALRDKGGLEGAMAWLPIEQIAKVITALYAQREQLKAEIYELTGISDLIRGATDANETATAQQIKGNFGNMRLEPRQIPIQRFARDVFRIAAEIMAEHFTAEHLQRMTGLEEPQPEMVQDPNTGQQVPDPNWQPSWTWQQVMQLLRDEKLRAFNVDIETDSTVAPDEEAEKKTVTEFMSATGEYFTATMPLVGMAPTLAPMVFEIFKASARRFKLGRELEEVIESTAQEMQEQAAQPPRPEPDPKAEADKAKAGAVIEKTQLDMTAAREKHQMEMEKMREQRMNDMVKARSQRMTASAAPGQNGEAPQMQPMQDDGAEMLASVLAEFMQAQQQQTQAIVKALTAPKQIVRGPDGRAQGVAPVTVN